MKCNVCSIEYTTRKSEHYIAIGNGKTGLAAFAGGEESNIYDAFDCPVCGCQIIAQERKRTVKTQENEEE